MKYSILSKIGIITILGMVLPMLISCSTISTPQGNLTPTDALTVVIHHSFSPAVVLTDIPEGLGSGWGMGFVRPEHLNIAPFDRPQTEEFRLSTGEDFSPYLIIGGNFQEPMSVLVTIVLDYEQVSFELDGQTGILHQLELPPNVIINLPMNLTIEQPGAHDLFVAAFASPDDHVLDAETRLIQHDRLAGRRTVVVVGDNEQPFKTLSLDMAGEPIPPSNSDYPSVAFATLPNGQTDIPPADRQFVITRVTPDENFSFQVIAKNEEDELMVYTMVTFLDFRQVSLDEDGVLLASVGPNEEVTFDGTIHIPDTSGVHELQVVYILDPYLSILRNEVTAPFVFGSVRVGLEVP